MICLAMLIVTSVLTLNGMEKEEDEPVLTRSLSYHSFIEAGLLESLDEEYGVISESRPKKGSIQAAVSSTYWKDYFAPYSYCAPYAIVQDFQVPLNSEGAGIICVYMSPPGDWSSSQRHGVPFKKLEPLEREATLRAAEAYRKHIALNSLDTEDQQ